MPGVWSVGGGTIDIVLPSSSTGVQGTAKVPAPDAAKSLVESAIVGPEPVEYGGQCGEAADCAEKESPGGEAELELRGGPEPSLSRLVVVEGNAGGQIEHDEDSHIRVMAADVKLI